MLKRSITKSQFFVPQQIQTPFYINYNLLLFKNNTPPKWMNFNLYKYHFHIW